MRNPIRKMCEAAPLPYKGGERLRVVLCGRSDFLKWTHYSNYSNFFQTQKTEEQ